jgi:glycolate oxidase iron-sulfur subunit
MTQNKPMNSSSPDLKKYEDIVAACNRCGFCTSYCPTYKATGNEIHSPRGRNQLFRALIEKKVTNPADALESINTCLLCGECTSVCFSEVPTAELMVHARQFLNNQLGTPFLLNFLFKKILPYPKRFYWVLKLSFFAKQIGIASLLEKTSFFKKVAPALAAANELMPTVTLKFLKDYKDTQAFMESALEKEGHAKVLAQQKSGTKSATIQQRPKAAYMTTCGSQYVLPSIGLASLKLFKKLHVDFVIPEMLCCGLPPTSFGEKEAARSLAEANIQTLEKGHFESILIDDSSCLSQMRDYPRIFQNDGKWLKRSHDLSQKVKELSSYLASRGLKDHLKLVPWDGGPVAFHEPCKSQYGPKGGNPTRELLSSIPHLKIMGIVDSDQCCGGGGAYSFMEAELSRKVLSAKIQNIISSGCHIVVTTSASCLIQLKFGLRQAHSSIQALHLSEFLVRALEKRR